MHQEESNNQFWAILGSLRMLLISEGESEMFIDKSRNFWTVRFSGFDLEIKKEMGRRPI